MTNLAISRRSDVVSRVEGDETLVLDLRTKTAHCLSGDLAAVWNADESSVAAIAAGAGLSESAVEAAVASLIELGLVSASAGMSRRMLVRGAAVGGALVAAGAVSIPLPAAARANSSTFTLSGTSCNNGNLTFTLNLTGSGRLTPGATYNVSFQYLSSTTKTDTHNNAFVADSSGLINGGAGITFTTNFNYKGSSLTFTVTNATVSSDTKTFALSATACA